MRISNLDHLFKVATLLQDSDTVGNESAMYVGLSVLLEPNVEPTHGLPCTIQIITVVASGEHSVPSSEDWGSNSWTFTLKNFRCVEYQGDQHIRPVEFLGGEAAFEKTKQHDQKKSDRCRRNGCRLVYVCPGYDFDEVTQQLIPHRSI
jgi:hypothetical protein